MPRSSHHHHDLAHSFGGAALDDIHRFRFRHQQSRKLTRKAVSPQLVETYAASSAVVEMTFDALDNDLHQDDRKSALEVPIIEEFMRRAMCRPRWCPHNRNAADAMTKFKGAHSGPLFTLLRTGMYTLKGEKSELADRATLRQTGTVPRHTVSAVRSVTERAFLFICHRIDGISFRCT